MSSTPGIDFEELIESMEGAGVDGAVLIPLTNQIDPSPALAFVERCPGRFVVMGRPPLDQGPAIELLEAWREMPGLEGLRVSAFLEPARSLFLAGELEWLWSTAERLGLRLMINAAGAFPLVGEIARSHESLLIAIDHMGLEPFRVYDDLLPEIDSLLALAQFPNVSVKASALPASVNDSFPFPSLHEPIRAVVDAFGPRRVFWGSDLTRLPCSYGESRKLFTDELGFLSPDERAWIAGDALHAWLGGDHESVVTAQWI